MISVRRSNERGHVAHGWLDTYHTFSFASYHDPRFTHFRNLRVINEDWVQPGRGFAPHNHNDMEIVTYILGGSLEHRDSLGVGSIINRGDVQRMSAGTGVTHSEFNPSKTEPVHLLQIWIFPRQNGLKPSYEQKTFPEELKRNKLCLIAAPGGRNQSLTIRTDVELYASVLDKDHRLHHDLAKGRHAWLQLIAGELMVRDLSLSAGDGLSFSDEPQIAIHAVRDAEFLLFDLP